MPERQGASSANGDSAKIQDALYRITDESGPDTAVRSSRTKNKGASRGGTVFARRATP